MINSVTHLRGLSVEAIDITFQHQTNSGLNSTRYKPETVAVPKSPNFQQSRQLIPNSHQDDDPSFHSIQTPISSPNMNSQKTNKGNGATNRQNRNFELMNYNQKDTDIQQPYQPNTEPQAEELLLFDDALTTPKLKEDIGFYDLPPDSAEVAINKNGRAQQIFSADQSSVKRGGGEEEEEDEKFNTGQQNDQGKQQKLQFAASESKKHSIEFQSSDKVILKHVEQLTGGQQSENPPVRNSRSHIRNSRAGIDANDQKFPKATKKQRKSSRMDITQKNTPNKYTIRLEDRQVTEGDLIALELENKLNNFDQVNLQGLLRERRDKKWKNLFILYIKIMSFVYKLKTTWSKRKPKLLRQQQVDMIGDAAFIKLNNMKKKLKLTTFNSTTRIDCCYTFDCTQFLMQWVGVLEKIPLISPTSAFTIFWNILSVLAICCNLFIFTIDLIMGQEDMYHLYGINWTGFNICIFVMYIADIMVNFNTSVYVNGFVLKRKFDIARNYINTTLFYDVLVLLPFVCEMVHVHWYFKFWNLLIFLKLANFNKIVTSLNFILMYKKQKNNMFKLGRLFLQLLFIAHIFSCVWQGIAQLETYDNPDAVTWMSVKGADQQPWFDRYIWGFYFAITTMTTIGYGDIIPANVLEAGLLVIGQVTASFCFAVLLNTIGRILNDITDQDGQLQRQLEMVNLYLQNKNSSPELIFKVGNYISEKFHTDKDLTNEEEKFIISKLPQQMQEQIIQENSMYIINANPHIFGRLSKSTQEKLGKKIKELRLDRNQIIFSTDQSSQLRDSEVKDHALYYISQGTVELYHQRLKSREEYGHLSDLKRGHTLGEYSFISNQKRTCSARTIEPTVLYYLSRSDFIEIVRKNTEDYQIFCMLRDQVLEGRGGNTFPLVRSCISCGKIGHYLDRCPLLHYVPDSNKIILRNNFSTHQERGLQYKRGQKRSTKAIVGQWDCEDEACNIRDQLQDDAELPEEIQTYFCADYSYIDDSVAEQSQAEDQNLQTAAVQELLNQSPGSSTHQRRLTRRITTKDIFGQADDNMRASYSRSPSPSTHAEGKQATLKRTATMQLNHTNSDNGQDVSGEDFVPSMNRSNNSQGVQNDGQGGIQIVQSSRGNKFLQQYKYAPEQNITSGNQIILYNINSDQNQRSANNQNQQKATTSNNKSQVNELYEFESIKSHVQQSINNNQQENISYQQNNGQQMVSSSQSHSRRGGYLRGAINLQKKDSQQTQSVANSQQPYQDKVMQAVQEDLANDANNTQNPQSNTPDNIAPQPTNTATVAPQRHQNLALTEATQVHRTFLEHMTLTAQTHNIHHRTASQTLAKEERDYPVQFSSYFPKHNFDAEKFVYAYNFSKHNTLPVKGYGVYTFFWRRIYTQEYLLRKKAEQRERKQANMKKPLNGRGQMQ